ncbi:PREDICTED: LOW QUALITY PROTEIN: uncharacterized protein LOC105501547, partial [Colobus angolensis palliatus]|uniref:LOW QUALITY PROTEIN: uncharacterized protein LOC105501547 n=1 Tax=Colobus angolensis palliatus TaxID=336983 RepID=UPI0005F3D964
MCVLAGAYRCEPRSGPAASREDNVHQTRGVRTVLAAPLVLQPRKPCEEAAFHCLLRRDGLLQGCSCGSSAPAASPTPGRRQDDRCGRLRLWADAASSPRSRRPLASQPAVPWRQHRGRNRPSAPSPVAAEGPRLEVSSSSTAGAGRGQGLAGSQARCTRDPEAAQAILHHLGAQLTGSSQAGWRSQPRRTGARCRRGCGQARRSAPRRLHRGGNQTPAPSPVAAEGPCSCPDLSSEEEPGGSHGQAGPQAGRDARLRFRDVPREPRRTRKPAAPALELQQPPPAGHA